MRLIARLKTVTENSVTLWDPDTAQHAHYYRLEVIAEGRAIVLFVDRFQWIEFADKCVPSTLTGPAPQREPPRRRRKSKTPS